MHIFYSRTFSWLRDLTSAGVFLDDLDIGEEEVLSKKYKRRNGTPEINIENNDTVTASV